ncbi:hypothetical protein [Pelotomaculum propionicicum]|uniref:hypothetical protein n=1 Tax=Pelotomaculum propionicicum TaxID=258475 RepID=UPI003BA04B0A
MIKISVIQQEKTVRDCSGLEPPICVKCSRATALLCPWIGENDDSFITKFDTRLSPSSNGLINIVSSVRDCRLFKEGELPRIPKNKVNVQYLMKILEEGVA